MLTFFAGNKILLKDSRSTCSFNNDKRRKVYVYFLKMSVIVNDDLFIKQKCVLNNAFK